MDVRIKAELYTHVGEKIFLEHAQKSFWKYLQNYLESRSLKCVYFCEHKVRIRDFIDTSNLALIKS